jgi:hypothetical protein
MRSLEPSLMGEGRKPPTGTSAQHEGFKANARHVLDQWTREKLAAFRQLKSEK